MLNSCRGNAIRANNTGPDLASSRVRSGDDGSSIRFPGNRKSLVGQALVGSHVHFYYLETVLVFSRSPITVKNEISSSDELHHEQWY